MPLTSEEQLQLNEVLTDISFPQHLMEPMTHLIERIIDVVDDEKNESYASGLEDGQEISR